jgi:hypothetical protein
MKYPKPGTPNPLVTLHVFDIDHGLTAPVELTWDGRLPLSDSIINEVVWLSSTQLLIKEVNRAATTGQVVLFDISQVRTNQLYGGSGAKGKIVRRLGKDGEQGDDGWIDAVCFSYSHGWEGLNCVFLFRISMFGLSSREDTWISYPHRKGTIILPTLLAQIRRNLIG